MGIIKNIDGKGTFGCLVSVVVIVAGLIVGLRVGPPYFAYKSLQDDVATQVSRAGAHFLTDEALLKNILDVAKKNNVNLKSENVKVERFAGQVHVVIDYSVPVDLIVTRHTFEFEIKSSSYVGTL